MEAPEALAFAFRRGPRTQDLGQLSVMRGRIAAEVATKVVRRESIPPGRHGVRATRVRILEQAGFEVRLDGLAKRGPEHCSVKLQGAWTERLATAFDGCFEAPHDWWEVPPGE